MQTFTCYDIQSLVGATNATPSIEAGMHVQLQVPGLNHDVMATPFFAEADVYDLTFHRVDHPQGGIVKTYMDGVLINTWDGYDAVGGTAHTITVPNITLTTGEHLITFEVDGKNGASGGYLAIHGWWSLVSH